MTIHEQYMRKALKLALRAEGRTSPNPIVCAIIVRGGKIVGAGFHKRAGGPHAEKIALSQAKEKARGATLYVTLEPCDHFGRTPPCTDALIASGIKKAYIGMIDPNPINNGKGIHRLNKHGIMTRSGILEKEAKAVNKPYIKYITRKMPYVTVKIAETLDGKIATRTGDSRWISSERSRRLVHRLRSRVDAILVGATTVAQDDPLLTVRLPGPSQHKDPIRVVIDSGLRTPIRSRIITTASRAPVIIATTGKAPRRRIARYTQKGAKVMVVTARKGQVNLKELFRRLAERGVMHLLVEGGAETIASVLDEGLADRLIFFISPKIVGGRNSPTSVAGEGIAHMRNALIVKGMRVRRSGSDIMIEAEL